MTLLAVTTSLRESDSQTSNARRLAQQLKGAFVRRNERSIQALFRELECSELLVVGVRLDYYTADNPQPFFYHPSMGYVRAKRVLAGQSDPLLDVCGVRPGDQFLDATLGLGADALLVSLAVGPQGAVTACESNAVLGTIVQEGLSSFEAEEPQLDQAARSIRVVMEDHYSYLLSCETDSVDVIYFDPMFRETVANSPGINRLKPVSDHRPLSLETIAAAKRVARRRIVLKERIHSAEFERLGFTPCSRHGRIEYGIIDVKSGERG